MAEKRRKQTANRNTKKPAAKPAKKQSANAGKRAARRSSKAAIAPPEEAKNRSKALQSLIAWLTAALSLKKGERDEFRYNYNEKSHPNYIFSEKDGKYTGFGVTHKAKTFDTKNMPLSKNPQDKKTEPAYIRTGVITNKKRNYGKRLNDFAFTAEDKAIIKSKKRNYKKVSKEKSNKNKKSK